MEDFNKLVENLQKAYIEMDTKEFESTIDLLKKDFKEKIKNDKKYKLKNKYDFKEKMSNLKIIKNVKKMESLTLDKLKDFKSKLEKKKENFLENRRIKQEEKEEKKRQKIELKEKKKLESKNLKSKNMGSYKTVFTLGKEAIELLKSNISVKYNDFRLDRIKIKKDKADEKTIKAFEKAQEKEMNKNEKEYRKAQLLKKKADLKCQKKEAKKERYVAKHMKPGVLALFKQKIQMKTDLIKNKIVDIKSSEKVSEIKNKMSKLKENTIEGLGIAIYIVQDKSSMLGKSIKRKYESTKKSIVKIPKFLVEKSKEKIKIMSAKIDEATNSIKDKKNDNLKTIEALKQEREKIANSFNKTYDFSEFFDDDNQYSPSLVK